MTSNGHLITQSVRDEAKGPHTLASAADGGYFLRQEDLPLSVEFEYSQDKRTLMMRFAYEEAEEDQEADDKVSDEMRFSAKVDGLRLIAFFAPSKRRIVAVQFRDCDLHKVDPKHLADGVASAHMGVEHPSLTAQQVLTLKGLAVVFRMTLPKLLAAFRDE